MRVVLEFILMGHIRYLPFLLLQLPKAIVDGLVVDWFLSSHWIDQVAGGLGANAVFLLTWLPQGG